MPKKGGGKKGKKGKKGPEDWGTKIMEKYVEVEVRNSVWQTLRFTQRLPTSTRIVRDRRAASFEPVPFLSAAFVRVRPQKVLVDMIIEQHKVAGMHGLSLYLGEGMSEDSLLKPEEYGLSLADVRCPGGSMNDHVLQVVTYDYGPHRTSDTGTIPRTRSYGIMHVPRQEVLPPLRQWGPG